MARHAFAMKSSSATRRRRALWIANPARGRVPIGRQLEMLVQEEVVGPVHKEVAGVGGSRPCCLSINEFPGDERLHNQLGAEVGRPIRPVHSARDPRAQGSADSQVRHLGALTDQRESLACLFEREFR